MGNFTRLQKGFWELIMKLRYTFRRKISILLFGAVMLSAYTAARAASSYTLSGSSDGTQPILVDDDLDVYLDGTLLYTDGTGTAGNRPPIPFSADGGNSLHIVVRDTYGDCSSLSPVYLTSAAGLTILVDPGFNLGCG